MEATQVSDLAAQENRSVNLVVVNDFLIFLKKFLIYLLHVSVKITLVLCLRLRIEDELSNESKSLGIV
ncbi:hypothetical protein LR48_Vigan11g134300 [Vigna angularis]|uniref:Uncharacterized protein n=1 Tax=Phaseolus angularis TaxID=3914 RepID=A0A0L9VU61_PHAAN|nr:hypothetical protein LR48_Vigan11g134300 [Vigna angularis]